MASSLVPQLRTRGILFSGAFLAAVVKAAAAAQAGDFGGADFSLRLPAALTRFSSYADVGGVAGAGAASPWSTSMNPAATAWKPIESKLHLTASPQYSALIFEEGTTLHVISEALTWETPGYGTVLPAAAQTSALTLMKEEGTTTASLLASPVLVTDSRVP